MPPPDLLGKAMAALEGVTVVVAGRSGGGEEVTSTGYEEASPMEVAAQCMDDAVNGRNLDFATGERELRLYSLFKRPWLSRTIYAAYAVYLALALFEHPAQPHLRAPFWATVAVEFVCVCVFLCRLFHELLFSAGGGRRFWSDRKHAAQAAMIALILADIVAYTAQAESGSPGAVRWSRPLRPLLAVNLPESRQVRAGFRNIRRTLPEVASVLFLFLSNTALFSLMAFKLFGPPREIGGAFFDGYAESAWSMYVLVTTANHPNVMMPALRASRWCALFFVAYLVVNLYMFMSVFLAVVYNRYRSNLKNEVRESLQRAEQLMDRTFDKVATAGREGLGRGVSKEAFLELCKRADCLKKKSPSYVDALWMVLDPSERGAVGRKDFGDLTELLKMPYNDITPRDNVFERFIPSVYRSKFSQTVRSVVRHRRFRHVFDLAIVVNAIFIGADVLEGISEQIFLLLFTAEILLKIYTFGPVAFSRKLWNVFDTVVVGSAVLISIAHASHVPTGPALDFLMVLRVTRIFKVFHGVPRFKVVINTLLHILPSLATYGSVLFIIYYFFAMIGMSVFAGKISTLSSSSSGDDHCGNANLKGSEFAAEGYCPNNFNDLTSSLTVLFELMVVNQWHVIAEGHVLAVGTKWARVFFLSFHIVCVIVILNIFTAFVLEAFILEYSASRHKVRSHLAERIYRMGLANGQYNSFTNTNFGDHGGGGGGDQQQQQQHKEGDRQEFFDADHESDSSLEDVFRFDQLDGGARETQEASAAAFSAASEQSPSYLEGFSARTPIRFHLSFRARSVQHLLERMFESDLRRDSEATGVIGTGLSAAR